jgi:hypothetical protein
MGDLKRRHIAIKLLHDLADIFEEEQDSGLDEEEPDPYRDHENRDEERDRDWRVTSHVMLLADLVNSATPPALINEVLPFDFPDPDIRAAYRLLLNHELDLPAARAAASHPDVAGVLESVLNHTRVKPEQYSVTRDPTFWSYLIWDRRRRLLEADRLRSVAAWILESNLAGLAAFQEANRAADEACDRLGWERAGESVPPGGLPSYVQTARTRLLDGQRQGTVSLEDGAVASRVVDLVEVADRQVLMAVPWLRSSSLTRRLVDACRNQVKQGVRILLVTRPVKSANQYAQAAADERTVKRSLAAAGVEIAWHRRLHDKVFVVDDTVICGSLNFTASDIARNPNSAIGTVQAEVVEQFARRIEHLAAQSDTYPGDPQVPLSEVPVFAYDDWSGVTHRLAVRGDIDLGRLEGGGEAPADCGEIVSVDSTSSIWAFRSGERCLSCRQPMT